MNLLSSKKWFSNAVVLQNLPEDPEIDSPVPQSTEEHPAPAPDSGNNEDTPFPSEDPDEKLKPEEHEPTNQKRCLLNAFLTVHWFESLV